MRLLCQLSVHLFILLLFCRLSPMGVNHRGRGTTAPPPNFEWGMLMQIVSPDFQIFISYQNTPFQAIFSGVGLIPLPVDPTKPSGSTSICAPRLPATLTPMLSPCVRAWSCDLCFDTVDPVIPGRSLRRIWPSVDYVCSRRPTNQELSCECV